MESYWEIVEPLFSIIDFGSGPEAFRESIGSIPHSSVILFSAHMCLAEVHNGGFLQLFWNNAGIFVPEGIEGFATIGLPGMAALLQDAARPLGSPYPRDREERWDAMLSASGLKEPELLEVFTAHRNDSDEAKGLYIAFAEATRNLPFNELEKKFWDLAETENGGFQEAATRFAQGHHLLP
jgi:hypothetical protein